MKILVKNKIVVVAIIILFIIIIATLVALATYIKNNNYKGNSTQFKEEIDNNTIVKPEIEEKIDNNAIEDPEIYNNNNVDKVEDLQEKQNIDEKVYNTIYSVFNKTEINKIYYSLCCNYVYIVLNNNDLYYLEKKYDSINENTATLVEELKEEKIKNILIPNNAENHVYILAESGKLYEHANNKISSIDLEGEKIDSIEGDCYIIFAITNSKQLIYWSNEATWDSNTQNYNYSINPVFGNKYLGNKKIVDIRYVKGISEVSKDKGYFIIATNGIYKINSIKNKTLTGTYYEFATLNDDNTYTANDLIKTNYTYSKNKKVKLTIESRYWAHLKNGEMEDTRSEDFELSELEKYVLQIEDDGIILLNEEKIPYGEPYHIPSSTVDAGIKKDLIFEKLDI